MFRAIRILSFICTFGFVATATMAKDPIQIALDSPVKMQVDADGNVQYMLYSGGGGQPISEKQAFAIFDSIFDKAKKTACKYRASADSVTISFPIVAVSWDINKLCEK